MDQAKAILSPRLRLFAERAGWVVAVSLSYYALAYVGTVLRAPPSGASIIWPAASFLTGVLLLTPPRYWWTYLLGLIPAHLHLVAHFDVRHIPVVVTVTQILGNIAIAMATAVVVRRASGPSLRFDSFRAVLVFILVAAIAVPATVGALVIAAHYWSGWVRHFGGAWGQRMLASVFPTITITPLIVLTATGPAMIKDDARSRAEILVVTALLFVTTYLTFGRPAVAAFEPALLLTPLPLLLWAAARWNVWGVSLALLVTAAAIIIRAFGGEGPFASGATAISVMSLQVYLSAISVPLILLAALMEELRRGQEQLRRVEARTGIAAALTDTGLWQWDAATKRFWLTEHCCKMFGLAPGAVGGPDDFLGAVHAEDRPRVRAALDASFRADDVQTLGEFRVQNLGGEDRWYVMRTRAERDSQDRPVRVTGIIRDITEWVVAHRQSEQLANRLLTLQEDERKNIAEALHDSTTQHLVAAGLITGMIERRITLTDEVSGLLDDMRGSLGKAVKELRTFTYLLRPPEIEQLGLRDVLEKYVRGFGMRTGMQVQVRVRPEADAIPLERQRALFRIAQESLANVHRHAEATRVSISLRPRGEELHMMIRDDGRGMEASRPGEPARLGVGIPGMTARIKQLGGTFDIRSSARGTVVHVALPVGCCERPRPTNGARGPKLGMLFGAASESRSLH